MKKSFEFMGRPSGDGEAFCWEVDKENWIKITEEEPDVYDYTKIEYDENLEVKGHGETLNLYPDHLFIKDKNDIFERFDKPIKIKIEWEEI